MDEHQFQVWVSRLDQAFQGHHELGRITAEFPDFDLTAAYHMQEAVVACQVKRGFPIIGYKMGLTSQAKMKQMGVSSPIFGPLTASMKKDSGCSLALADFIHPKIEPEIVFALKLPLDRVLTRDSALDAIDWVAGGMEVIDSRYKNFEFELPDVIADNCSSTAFLVGKQRRDPREINIGNLGMVLLEDGQAKGFASSAAIYGDPLESLIELSRLLSKHQKILPAGSIVLAGGATAAIPMRPGSIYQTQVQDLGSVDVSVL